MPRRKQLKPKEPICFGDCADPQGLAAAGRDFVAWLEVTNHSPFTVECRGKALRLFIEWAAERGLTRLDEVSPAVLARYQHWLYHYRKADGQPLTFLTQQSRLVSLRMFFKWTARQHRLAFNPASELDLPRTEHHLPRFVLTAAEADQVINQPNVHTPVGLRDRAILETFYSTGLRRSELANLKLWDVDGQRGVVTVRQGKGKKDRTVPVGERALAWMDKYRREARAQLAAEPDDGTLFLTCNGQFLSSDHLSRSVRDYVREAKLTKQGSCHLFRHTMATLMLENGADIRYIQEILGHARLSTTQIYTQGSIQKLKEVHAATHPARLHPAPAQASGDTPGPATSTAPPDPALVAQLFAALDAERADEEANL